MPCSRASGAAGGAAPTPTARPPCSAASRCGAWPRTTHAFELARRYENWPVCDMVCVAVAERAGTEFVTADTRLRARLAHLGWVKLPAEITVGG